MNRPPTLAQTQRRLQHHVLGEKCGIESWIRGDERADVATRLAVYVRAYRLRLLEALGKDYPTLASALGAEDFEHLGRAYLDAHPSDTRSLRGFGRHLPEFLRRTPAYAVRPELGEIAQWEWALGEVFDAADAVPATIAELADVPAESWPGMRLVFIPALRRLELLGNAPALCRAVQSGQALSAWIWNEVPQPWLIWRDARLEVRWRSLDPDEADVFDAARAGASFAKLCERLAQRAGEDAAPLKAASLLKRWLTDGLIAALDGVRV